MYKKDSKSLVFGFLFTILLLSHEVDCTITYIPEALRGCIVNLHEMTGKKSGNAVQELYTMIAQNRVLASDTLVCSAISDALGILKKSNSKNEWQKAAKKYMKEYIKNLDDRSILLQLQGQNNTITAFPSSLVARSLKIDSTSLDMLYLSSELTTHQNIELCGNAPINFDSAYHQNRTKSIKPTELSDPSLIFNPNMLTSGAASSPTIISGTGASLPIINAWPMVPSSSTQSPINMQFAIPGDLKTEKAISIEMHFLVRKNFVANGNARIRISGLYMSNQTETSQAVTHITDSDDFMIIEPTDPDGFMHISVDVPIEKSDIDKTDFALISLTRIPTDDAEYLADIYLTTAVFRYTLKK